MEIILSNSSSKPIYEQIVIQIKELIMQGKLKPNDPLPSMRKLAKDLHVSIITTQRAYDELSNDGFIVVIPAKKEHLLQLQNKDFIQEENRRRIEKTLLDVCTLAKQNGISKKELMTTLEIIFEEM
ncbi:MAG: GntR family transcriptional regulator [Thomasclavelia sp.]